MKIIGNQSIILQINIAAKSAAQQNKSIPHIMLSGAAGCGKTTTAQYIATITGAKFMSIACDSLKTSEDIYTLVNALDDTGWTNHGQKINGSKIRPTVVFIDEIHGLATKAQEYLGILMEQWELPSKIDKSGTTVGKEVPRKWAPRFTLIGATTDDGKLGKPFRDRFKLRFLFTPYNYEESLQIVQLHADRMHIPINEQAKHEIAKRGRGVPRVLIRYLERCYDMALAVGYDGITEEIAILQFSELGVDENGLDEVDIKLLIALYEIGEPVGLDNLAVQLIQPPKVLSETSEPFLVQQGFIVRTSRGRKITSKGKQYLIDNKHIESRQDFSRIDIPADFDRGEI